MARVITLTWAMSHVPKEALIRWNFGRKRTQLRLYRRFTRKIHRQVGQPIFLLSTMAILPVHITVASESGIETVRAREEVLLPTPSMSLMEGGIMWFLLSLLPAVELYTWTVL